MITDHEQRQLEARRRLLGSWNVDLEASELASPLDASQASKTSYRRTALTVKPKPSLRRERPKTEIVKGSSISWWVGLSREELAQEVKRREAERLRQPEFVLMSGFGSGE